MAQQPRMVVALSDIQRVRRNILTGDEPRLAAALLAAAEADTLALPEGVKREADVFADHVAVGGFHRTGVGRQIAVQEVAERPFADEADAGGIFLLRVRERDLFGNLAEFGFRNLARRKPRLRYLGWVQSRHEL